MEATAWVRNPVWAVQITKENIDEVAQWCGGRVSDSQSLADMSYSHILFDSVHNTRVREAKAYVGDWMIQVSGEWFECSRDGSFRNNHSPLPAVPSNQDRMKKNVERREALLGLLAEFKEDSRELPFEVVAHDIADRVVKMLDAEG